MALKRWDRSSKVRTAQLFDSHQISLFDEVQKQQITGFQWKTDAAFIEMDSLGSVVNGVVVMWHFII
jgi:hypothetical protein